MRSKIIILISVIAIILFSRFFPIIYAIAQTPKGYVYSGQTALYDPDDVNTYVAAINYGQEKHLLLKNLYTTNISGNNPSFIYPIYTLTGYLFPHIDQYTLFIGLAIVSSTMLCLVIYLLSYKILNNFYWAVASMFLVTRGGGFGWLSFPLGFQGADLFWSGITFSTALQRAHVGIGIAFYLSTLVLYFYYLKERKWIFGLASYICAIALVFLYPYFLLNIAITAGVLSVSYMLKYQDFRILLRYIIGGVFLLIAAVAYRHVIAQGGFVFALDEELPKLDFIPAVTGYGVFVVLSISLLFIKTKQKFIQERRFFLLWIIISFVLAYSQLGFGRIFLKGLFFPLTLLSIILIMNISKNAVRIIVTTLFCILMPLTAIFVSTTRMWAVNIKSNYIYISTELEDMFNYLKTVPDQNGVLSLYRIGNFIPAKTGKSVYIGHVEQTPNLQPKLKKANEFYGGSMTDVAAQKFLAENNISFVVYGSEENNAGGHVYPFLKLVFTNSRFTLYSI